MLRALFLLPVLVFVVVSCVFNTRFSASLGSDELTRSCWIAVGLAAAFYAALGFDLARQSWRRGSWPKAAAALLLWAPAVAYDSLASYRVMAQEQGLSTQRHQETARIRTEAENKLQTARAALQLYADAPDLESATETVKALEAQTNDARCRLPRLVDRDRELCDQLGAARIAHGRAKARSRLAEAVQTAETVLDRTKPPAPKDAAVALLGRELVNLLPMLLLQLGLLFGIFAAALPPKSKPIAANPRASKPLSLAAPEKRRASHPASDAPSLTTATVAGNGGIVNLIKSLATDQSPPSGISVDADGWVRGGQRQLAKLQGVPLSRFHKELQVASRAGLIDVDTSHGTAIRVAPSASRLN